MLPAIGHSFLGHAGASAEVRCARLSAVGWNGRNEAKAGTPSESCASNRVGSFRRKRGDVVSAT